MPLTTVTVTIAVSLVTGGALPNGQVRFELTGSDVDGGIVVPQTASVTLDANGAGTIALWPNSRGTNGTQYRVMVYSSGGDLMQTALATVPTLACNLHEILDLDGPLVVSPVLIAEPVTTWAGRVVIADGTLWDPGSGAGLYRRNTANTAWVFVG